jgi:hypothetical protein
MAFPFRRAPVAAAVLWCVFQIAPASAQIRINEIYPNPDPAPDDGNERVEIYNAGPTAVNLTGWAIEDAATIDTPGQWRCLIPEGFDTALCPGSAIIQPGEFRVIKGITATAWLNNSGGDVVYLVSDRNDPNGTVVDIVTYPTALPEQVWAAVPNGSSNFAWRTKTPCATNGSVGDVTPPATVADLAAAPGVYAGEIRLTWTAPGDDGMAGTASLYDIKVSHAPITGANFAAAADLERWINEPVPAAGGAPETLFVFGLDPDSTWHFALRASDEVPNLGGVSNSAGSAPFPGPRMDPDLGTSVYFGNLHSHTGYSDGVQTPADAWFFARNTAQTPLDFLAVTEHNHSGAGKELASYQQGHAQAAAANDDGEFVAIFGQEWGVAAQGHVNIFESPVLFGWESGNYDVFVAQGDYANLYSAIVANPPASHAPVAEWCHPALGDFDGLAVTPEALACVRLMALVNGPFDATVTDESAIGNTGFDGAFQQALRNGMRVSPTADQDNHNPNWGAASESRTAVHASAKTKSEILAALAARRCYASQDHNARVDFSANGHAMGEAFTSASGVRIAAEVTDPDVGERVTQIELFRGLTGTAYATRIAFNTGSPVLQWRELDSYPPGTEAHYYLRIRMADNQSLWTGPVYVTYDPAGPTAVDPARIGGISLAAGPNPARRDVAVRFTLPHGDDHVRLAVYDLSGARLRTLVDRPLAAGDHAITWDGLLDGGRHARAGVVFLRLETGHGTAARKLVLLR